MDCPACGSPVTLEVGPDRPLSTSLSDAVLAAEEDEHIEVTRDCWDCGWHETRALRVASTDTTAGDETAVERAALIDKITRAVRALRMRPLGVILLALLLATAGCVTPFSQGSSEAPTPTPTASPTPASSDSITVEGGTLPVDADTQFEQVVDLLGTDTDPPSVIRIRSTANLTREPYVPEFLQRLGVTYDRETVVTDAFASSDQVQLRRSVLADDRFEYVLAHEFTHVVQHRSLNASRRIYTGFENGSKGLDNALLTRSLIEGGATYVGNRYWQQYIETPPEPSADLATAYREANSSGARYGLAPYYFGYRYFDRNDVQPDLLGEVYTNPPQTTEQLLHGHKPGSEPPANLTVSTAVDRWSVASTDRVGELGTRLVVRTKLNRSRAAGAAAGWGNDRLLRFEGDGRPNYVWVHRWDDRANATEFEDAFRDYLDRRGSRTDDGSRARATTFRFHRTAPQTTVILFGQERFVSTVSVDGLRSVTIREC